MTNFLDVVKNWGDFAGRQLVPTGSRSGAPLMAREGMDRGFQLAEGPQGFSPTSNFAYTDSEPGYRTAASASAAMMRRYGRRLYEARMKEVANLTLRAFKGGARDRLNFMEAMSISDFPNLFGDVIDRAVLANYLETPYTWNLIAKQSSVNDFRPVKRFRVDGGTGLLATTSTGIANVDSAGALTPLEQGAQYPEDSLSDQSYTYRLFKVGKRMPFFWETFVNDDLDAIKDTPARFGRGARRTEEYFVTWLYAAATSSIIQQGNTISALYSNANKNIVNNTNVGDSGGNNPVLSITALQRALIVLMKQLDTTGQPINVEAVTLVVPPSLKVVAQNILNSDYVFMSDQGGTQTQLTANNSNAVTPAQFLHAMNWAKNIVRLAVNYYLPIIDTVTGNTAWYLFANPENGRPAIEFGKLRGHETPELFMKLPNSVAIGEGTMGPGPGVFPGTTNMNPMEGDFDTDAVHYKVRHVLGGTRIDPLMTCFSSGAGS